MEDCAGIRWWRSSRAYHLQRTASSSSDGRFLGAMGCFPYASFKQKRKNVSMVSMVIAWAAWHLVDLVAAFFRKAHLHIPFAITKRGAISQHSNGKLHTSAKQMWHDMAVYAVSKYWVLFCANDVLGYGSRADRLLWLFLARVDSAERWVTQLVEIHVGSLPESPRKYETSYCLLYTVCLCECASDTEAARTQTCNQKKQHSNSNIQGLVIEKLRCRMLKPSCFGIIQSSQTGSL